MSLKSKHLAGITTILALFIFNSCQNETSTEFKTLTSNILEAYQAESMNELAINIVESYTQQVDTININNHNLSPINNQTNTFNYSIDQITLTVQKESNSRSVRLLALDFGSTGKTYGEITLKGIIHIQSNGKQDFANSIVEYSYNNLRINDLEFIGSNKVSYKLATTNSSPYWIIQSNMIVRRSNSDSIMWQSKQTRTVVENDEHSNSNPVDISSRLSRNQKYLYIGTTEGKDSKGHAFSLYIDPANPLMRIKNFPFYTKGKTIITYKDHDYVFDFGDGKEDFIITSTIEGVSIDYLSL